MSLHLLPLILCLAPCSILFSIFALFPLKHLEVGTAWKNALDFSPFLLVLTLVPCLGVRKSAMFSVVIGAIEFST